MATGQRDINPLVISDETVPLTIEGQAARIRYHAGLLLDQRLMDGTASATEVALALHYDPEIDSLQKEETKARTSKVKSQTKYMEAQANSEQLAKEAIEAFKSYQSSSGGSLC